MKNNRTLLILLAVFIVLAIVLAYQTSRPIVQPTAPTPGVSGAHVFPDLTLDGIQGIRLRSPETGATFALARGADGVWTAPGSNGTLDLRGADGIARTMVLLPYNDSLPVPQGADMATYGFTPEGVLSIEILLTGGRAHAVAVGYRTPTEDTYYALVDERPDLYLLERAAVDFLILALREPPIA
jgi:hypothetical protein